MMRSFYNAARSVNVLDVVIRSGVTNKYPREVMAIKFGATFAGNFDTDARSKNF
jgi:hypothetical protein